MLEEQNNIHPLANKLMDVIKYKNIIHNNYYLYSELSSIFNNFFLELDKIEQEKHSQEYILKNHVCNFHLDISGRCFICNKQLFKDSRIPDISMKESINTNGI